ncbi:4-deoxy-4-formamido-L-arabinose-phosphoundecaprenol deformylase [Escherichia coli]|nr:4-deoxy-4-formamido-L-arabinose-phosphoundecaprenol deformylase [Escherichia coli]
MTKVGLRIDVDTFRGTREGVPRLLEILSKHNIQASIFFSVGPDNMGRHLWRLVKPQFLWKMLRSNAASLYGWDILLARYGSARVKRLVMPMPISFVKRLNITKSACTLWDHHARQARSGNWDRQTMIDDIARGLRTLEEIIGQPVTCSAAAGWRADQKVIEAKEAFHLRYNSDCRGAMPFRPLLESGNPGTAQIPVTLPTRDEVIGRDVKAEDFNGWLLNRILRDKGTPVYTIHAEVEGCAYQHNFVDLLKRAAQGRRDIFAL